MIRTEAKDRTLTCIKCAGTGFACTRITDPKTGRVYDVFRCTACDNTQWSPATKE